MGFSLGALGALIVGVGAKKISDNGKKSPSAKAAESAITPPMPDQMALDMAAQRQSALEASRQSGRASTILSSGTDTGDQLGP